MFHQSKPILDRFLEKIGEPEAGGCRRWLAAHDREGYPIFGGPNGTWTAARLGYVLLDDEGVPRETPFKIDNSHQQVGQACRGYKLDRKS